MTIAVLSALVPCLGHSNVYKMRTPGSVDCGLAGGANICRG